jgi:hypothetical protein
MEPQGSASSHEMDFKRQKIEQKLRWCSLLFLSKWLFWDTLFLYSLSRDVLPGWWGAPLSLSAVFLCNLSWYHRQCNDISSCIVPYSPLPNFCFVSLLLSWIYTSEVKALLLKRCLSLYFLRGNKRKYKRNSQVGMSWEEAKDIRASAKGHPRIDRDVLFCYW